MNKYQIDTENMVCYLRLLEKLVRLFLRRDEAIQGVGTESRGFHCMMNSIDSIRFAKRLTGGGRLEAFATRVTK